MLAVCHCRCLHVIATPPRFEINDLIIALQLSLSNTRPNCLDELFGESGWHNQMQRSLSVGCFVSGIASCFAVVEFSAYGFGG